MYWELSDQIWWGDRGSPEDTKGRVKAIISVAHNPELRDRLHRSPYHVLLPQADPAQTCPYYWFPRPDEVAADKAYLRLLDHVYKTAQQLELYPLLVHCFAGQHRSPAVALYMQLCIDGFTAQCYQKWLYRLHVIRPDIIRPDHRSGVHAFGPSMHQLILQRISERVA